MNRILLLIVLLLTLPGSYAQKQARVEFSLYFSFPDGVRDTLIVGYDENTLPNSDDTSYGEYLFPNPILDTAKSSVYFRNDGAVPQSGKLWYKKKNVIFRPLSCLDNDLNNEQSFFFVHIFNALLPITISWDSSLFKDDLCMGATTLHPDYYRWMQSCYARQTLLVERDTLIISRAYYGIEDSTSNYRIDELFAGIQIYSKDKFNFISGRDRDTDVCVSTLPLLPAASLKVWPSPASEYMAIDCDPIARVADIRVYDMLGRKMYEGSYEANSKITVSGWPVGAYTIVATGPKGYALQRIVKE